jgi:CRISPR-associated endonuclease/helicase Cas3
LKQAVKSAAKYHDHGKRRALFQRVLGNTNPTICWAKSGSKKGSVFEETYRHEFGSLLDFEKELESLNLGEHQDLVLHLIAAHHGRARPHFPAEEVFDPDHTQIEAERIAAEVPRRFARLQRKYGRWGLAYLESLLRAADWAASAKPSRFVGD